MPEKIVLISNRLPVTIEKSKEKIIYRKSVGGLVTGLQTTHNLFDITWVGWPGINYNKIKKELPEIEKTLNSKYACVPIFLRKNDIENYYHGFCNKTIWPLFHYFPQYTVYNNTYWSAYQRVNRLYCKLITNKFPSNSTIWIQDFHLMLLPYMLRNKFPDAKIGFFLHIPFPSFELFRLLPWRKELLQGLLGADLIGFHTYNYTRHFLNSLFILLGLDSELGIIRWKNRLIKVDTFPLGIDFEKYFQSAQDAQVQVEVNSIRKMVGDHKIIFSIDRLDYTKGIPQRLEMFEYFLEKFPQHRNKVTFICVAVPSRTGVDKYQELRRQTNELVGRINGRFGEIGWTPIRYIHRRLPFHQLAALYNIADVGLITPLRDGMNLVAKEFIATKRDGKGVLILSETAGAAQELGEALIVNTNNKEEMAETLNKALQLPVEEQIRRNRLIQSRLRRYNASKWAQEFIHTLNSIKKQQKELRAKELSAEMRMNLIEKFKQSKSRLLLLDYDGTLIHYFKNPADAKPTKELYKLLKKLTDNEKNEIVIISGRGKENLEEWLGTLNINLVAENSVWVREKNSNWKKIVPLHNEWKNKIRPILETYRDRTPGSFIEEKEYILIWHYEDVSSELGAQRSREIADIIRNLSIKSELAVTERDRALEIKNIEINKKKAASYWLEKKKWDFIMAIGDNMSDEGLFGVIPKFAYSIKVGSNPTLARFTLKSTQNVISLLEELLD
ncbi:MAG: bifunctional alpha,alpha-trehalose-phosphate synthase (UDP-forming)/trehalose-phosphatase [Candidatus Helarchaeota archaeon]